MSDTVYYFTGTGNSLYAAKGIADRLSMDLQPIVQEMDTDQITGNVIGIVFPVYMFNAPRLVYSFLKKIKAADYVFAIATMAGECGKTMKKVKKVLAQNDVALSAGFFIIAPTNYIVWHGAKSEKRQKELKEHTDTRLKQIAERIRKRETFFDRGDDLEKRSEDKLGFPLNMVPECMIQVMSDIGLRMIPGMDKSFRTTDGCNGCGTCARVCPVGNIEMSDDKPVWKHACEQCMACIQWCPKQAIEFGRKTVGRERYHHMDVTLKDMLAQREQK